ncbi:MAG TPA: DUF4286 family protein [Chitinophagaceae bacterium]|nr:DUF4286 family protein [Chitinophagaceae bacterium]MCC6635729.1 DUF4286 family protein [Chitinophagaceae bacterium]HMZ46575.1 DUF4286 family protein [Chitinophagaceae bacterium]HNE93280.1 DUF4286 family protein [Chitinophagaceae bacterium]HNF28984.1 DUF4286 family protein [Chitinophagaceae bacterium]
MFIYNVTIQVEPSIHDAWLIWLQNIHIPEVMNTGCFTKYQLVKLLDTKEEENTTYAVQYYLESKADYNRYIELFAPLLREAGLLAWGNKFAAFRTFMQVVN